MQIRTRLALVSTLLVAAFALGILGLLGRRTSTRFLEVERTFARRDADRVRQALHREIEAVQNLSRDWANWDDLHAFAKGRNPVFRKSNLAANSFLNASLAFIAIYDADHQRVFAMGLEPGGSELRELPFPDQAPAEGLPEYGKAQAGIARGPSGLLLTCSAPILPADGRGPSAGTLILGRRLDGALFEMLSRQAGVPFRHNQDPGWIPEFSPGRLLGQGVLLQESDDGGSIQAFQAFTSIRGEPLLVVRTTTPRPIAEALSSVRTPILLQTFLLAACVCGLTWIAFNRWISRPLARIEGALEALNLDEESPGADAAFDSLPTGPDEVGHIEGALRAMLARMRASQFRSMELREHLESLVEVRTADLTSANQRLALYREALESTTEGLLVTDTQGTIQEVNTAMCRQSGYRREDLIGNNPRMLKSSRHGSDFYRRLWQSVTETGGWSGEIWDRKPTGEIYPKWVTISTIRDSEGRPSHYVALSTDISAIKSAEERLHHMAYYDQLTGLPNRLMFADRLRRTVIRTRRKHTLSALMFLDLDRFKVINDTLGHSTGDTLLVRVAERINARLRESDTVCRMGGDEFTVILGEIAHLEDAGQVAADLIQELSRRFEVGGNDIYVGASIGIALCPLDGLDEETLIKKADAAMYTAKEAGRCTFRFASGELDALSRKRMELESRLHGALERQEFVLHYQPIARTREARRGEGRGLSGAEALLRWSPEPGTLLGPGAFIEIAEDAGLIPAIGAWVIQEACREARRWMDAGLSLCVSVNVSARQFEDNRLTVIVRDALEAQALPPERLKLEITESAFMRNMDRVVGIMDELRSLGVRFAIDDFGTGYSSLQYIKCLPAHSLKIDKAFVSGVASNLSDAEIVSAIIALSRAFGLSSTAEGVETEDQLRELRDRGCDEVQGYLIGRPMDGETFQTFARNDHAL